MEERQQDQDSLQNQRKLKRYQLTALVDIVNHQSQDMVGRLVNVHTEGLMIIGEFAFEEEKIYSLDLVLPKTFEKSTITLEVDCLWTRPSQDQHAVLWSGFSIVNCTEEARSDIEVLIEAMGV